MVGLINNLAQIIIMQEDMSQTEAMLLGQRSRSQEVGCAHASANPVCVQPITLSCIARFKKNNNKKKPQETTTMSLGQRSGSQSALKLYA